MSRDQNRLNRHIEECMLDHNDSQIKSLWEEWDEDYRDDGWQNGWNACVKYTDHEQ